MDDYFGKIAELVRDVQNTTEHDVFLNYSGHVNSIEVYVYLGGWVMDGGPDIKIEFYCGDDLTEGTKKNFKETITMLEGLLE